MIYILRFNILSLSLVYPNVSSLSSNLKSHSKKVICSFLFLTLTVICNLRTVHIVISLFDVIRKWKHWRKMCWPFKHQPHKMVKHTQTIRRLLPTNCLSVFDHCVGLALKGLILFVLLMTFINIQKIMV